MRRRPRISHKHKFHLFRFARQGAPWAIVRNYVDDASFRRYGPRKPFCGLLTAEAAIRTKEFRREVCAMIAETMAAADGMFVVGGAHSYVRK